MTRRRLSALAILLVASGLLAYLLRDVVYGVLIVPLAYLFWLAGFYLSAVPQLIWWILLLLALLLMSAPSFLPEIGAGRRVEHPPAPVRGEIEALSSWIAKSRRGTFFKWQIANRLGRLWRGWAELSGGRAEVQGAVARYLDAGLNNSFVDYPRPGNRFRRPEANELDLDPQAALDVLESHLEAAHVRRP